MNRLYKDNYTRVKKLARSIYRDRRSYITSNYQAILIGSRTTIFYQAIYVDAVQPLILKLLNWKPYNHFFISQAI